MSTDIKDGSDFPCQNKTVEGLEIIEISKRFSKNSVKFKNQAPK
jgi:hypothetical protein